MREDGCDTEELEHEEATTRHVEDSPSWCLVGDGRCCLWS